MVRRPVCWIYGQQTLQNFNKIAGINFRQALNEVAQVDLKEQPLVKVIAVNKLLKKCSLK